MRPGTLDDPSIARPVAQIWTSLAQPWAVAEGVRCFEEDVEGLLAEWRGRLG